MNRDLPERKEIRLKNYEYNNVGTYFITFCTQNKKNILSEIEKENENFVGEGFPLPKLLNYGIIVENNIKHISNKFKNITVEKYVIMPNHVHILLSVNQGDGRGNPSPTINSVIGWLKYNSTKEINLKSNIFNKKIFQRSFYDHVVRNEKDYIEILEYIINNPLKWQLDKYYQE